MASGFLKKRKSPSSDSKHASPKKKKPFLSPPKERLPSAQDSKGCTVLSKLINSGVISDHEPVRYLRKKDRSVMKEGALTREGVLCACCGHIFLLSRFEVHAGSGLHRPSANMFLNDGRSLMQCQQAIESAGVRIETPNQSRTDCSSSNESSVTQANTPRNEDVNDNICQMCGDGGQLILCDTCPSAFHADCLHLDVVPDGEWHCPRCRCGECGAAIFKACFQRSGLTDTPADHSYSSYENEMKVPVCSSIDNVCSQEDDARVLTRPGLESKSSSVANKKRSSILPCVSCAHCQVPYHSGCVKGVLQHECDGHWFCSKHCKHVFRKLRKLMGRPLPLDRGLSWLLIRSCKEDKESIQKSRCTSFERKLSEAYKVMQQSFDPVIDYETGVNMLSQTLFNKKADLRRLDCSGFYTMLLMKGEKMVSVASFRVHGRELAEMPFVATKDEFRQQGMCKALMKVLESMLIDIGIYKLVLPSVDELLETWRVSFGFREMNLQERKQVSHVGILSFVGTTLLHKSLMRSEAVHIQEPVEAAAGNKGKPGYVRIRLKLHAPSKPATSFQPISCH